MASCLLCGYNTKTRDYPWPLPVQDGLAKCNERDTWAWYDWGEYGGTYYAVTKRYDVPKRDIAFMPDIRGFWTLDKTRLFAYYPAKKSDIYDDLNGHLFTWRNHMWDDCEET